MYESIGVHPIPIATLCRTLVSRIKTGGGGAAWSSYVASALTGSNTNVAPSKRLKEIDIHEILFLAGNEKYTPMSDGLYALQYLILLILNRAGVIAEAPVSLYYRTDFRLTLSEIVDRTLKSEIEAVFPTSAEINGDMRWSTFIVLLPVVVNKLETVLNRDTHVASRIRSGMRDIGWKIFKGEPISDSERSLFLLLASGGSHAKLDSEAMPPASLGMVGPTNDDSVRETLLKVFAACEAGPASKFYRVSVRDEKPLKVIAIGPGPISYTLSAGFREAAGRFSRWVLTPIETVSLTEETTLAAVADEAAVFIAGTVDEPFEAHPPMMFGSTASCFTPLNCDEPAFELYYGGNPGSKEAPDVEEYDIRYNYKLLGRYVSTEYGDFENGIQLVYDAAFSGSGFGEGRVASFELSPAMLFDSLFSTTCVVRSGVAKEDGQAAGPFFLEAPRIVERIVYPDKELRRVMSATVEVTQLYYRQGEAILFPGLTEFARVPRSFIWKENPTAESLIKAELRLSGGIARLAAGPIRVSHNVAWLQMIFGVDRAPQVDRTLVALTTLV